MSKFGRVDMRVSDIAVARPAMPAPAIKTRTGSFFSDIIKLDICRLCAGQLRKEFTYGKNNFLIVYVYRGHELFNTPAMQGATPQWRF
jgi:hypothetical protein